MNFALYAILQLISGGTCLISGLNVIFMHGDVLGFALVAIGLFALGMSTMNWIDYHIQATAKSDGYRRMVDEERFKAEVGK